MSSGVYISDAGDFELDDDGHLLTDDTIETRCRIRLQTHRGQWLDKDIGSRLNEIKLLKHAERKMKDAIREALQPLIDSGEIVELRLSEAVTDSINGLAAIAVEIVVPGDDLVDLGLIPIGGSL